jgi:hypothetical protein
MAQIRGTGLPRSRCRSLTVNSPIQIDKNHGSGWGFLDNSQIAALKHRSIFLELLVDLALVAVLSIVDKTY